LGDFHFWPPAAAVEWAEKQWPMFESRGCQESTGNLSSGGEEEDKRASLTDGSQVRVTAKKKKQPEIMAATELLER